MFKKQKHLIPYYITLTCIFIPIIQIIIGMDLNRIVLLSSAFPLIFFIPRINNKYLLLILFLFVFVLFGMATGRGFIYSSFSAPLIFGIIFFFYFDRRIDVSIQSYQRLISSIYKVLLIGFIVEMVFNFIDPWFLYTTLQGNNVIDYERVRGKITAVFHNIPFIVSINSLYIGNQIASMVSLSAMMWFFPFYGFKSIYIKNRIWFFLSVFYFIYTFSFTAIMMFFLWIFLTVILIPHSRNNLLIFSSISFPLVFTLLYKFFSTGKVMTFGSPLEHYFLGFIIIMVNFYEKLTLYSKLFGIPHTLSIGDFTSSNEFGYFIILMQIGLIFVGTIIFLNIRALVLIKNVPFDNYITFMAKLNLIIFTVWHFSLIHYLPALKTGPAQLFGIHIALFLLFLRKYNLIIKEKIKSNVGFLMS